MAIKDFPGDMSSAIIDANNDLLLFADASDSNNAKKTTASSMLGQCNTSMLPATTDHNYLTDAEQTKLGHITVTQAVDLDTMESDIAGKEPTISAGTTSQYRRGDKSWQTLDKTAVGLGNVDNTSDSTKNSAVVTLTNKTIDLTSNTLTGTKAQFDTAVTDGNFLYVGDVTSNATHTGDVTGDTALTIDKTAITGKTAVTAVGTDYVLISDTSDSGNLKKALVSDFGGGGSVGPGTINEIAYFDTTTSIASLPVATYPSLTELTYVKGVTSAIQTQLSAKVTGPASATDNAIARFDSTTGKLIQDSGATLGDDASISGGNFYLTALANGVSIEGSASLGGRVDIYATGSDTDVDLYLDAQGAGRINMGKDVVVPDEAYGAGWNGSLEVPTKNAVYDKIETMGGGGDVTKVGTPVNNQLGVWTGDGTLEGTADVTYDSSTKAMTFNQILDGATFAVYTANTAENSYSYLEFSDTEAAIDTPAFSLITGASLFSLNQGGTDAIFNVSGLASTNKTFTFPNATGTVSLIANTETLTNKTLTSPKFADLGFIADANGNELIIFDTVTSAVNELTLANAATGANPTWTASGGDSNIGIDWQSKGTGTYNLKGNATQAAELRLYEDTDNGTNYIGFKTATAVATSIVYTLPEAPAADGYVLASTTAGVQSRIPLILDRVTNNTTVNSSTSETTIYTVSVPANTLSTNKRLKFSAVLSHINNSGSTAACTVKIKYGGTTFGNVQRTGMSTSTGTRAVFFEAYLRADGATNAQAGYLSTNWMNPGSWNGAETAAGGNRSAGGTAAIDSTSAQTFLVSVQHDVNNANTSISLLAATLEVI